jgi:hypothetical protein
MSIAKDIEILNDKIYDQNHLVPLAFLLAHEERIMALASYDLMLYLAKRYIANDSRALPDEILNLKEVQFMLKRYDERFNNDSIDINLGGFIKGGFYLGPLNSKYDIKIAVVEEYKKNKEAIDAQIAQAEADSKAFFLNDDASVELLDSFKG